jgi:hypothetical protein
MYQIALDVAGCATGERTIDRREPIVASTP